MTATTYDRRRLGAISTRTAANNDGPRTSGACGSPHRRPGAVTLWFLARSKLRRYTTQWREMLSTRTERLADSARKKKKKQKNNEKKQKQTSNLAVAEGPRDALSQLKSCQLLHNNKKNHI